eukprot:423712_1
MGNTLTKDVYYKYDSVVPTNSGSELHSNSNVKIDYDHYDIQQKIVHAYINQTFANIDLYGVIPDIIYYVCFMFYLNQFDKWNSNFYNKFVVLSSTSTDKLYDRFTIRSNRWKTIYGSIMVDCMRYSNGCIYEWKLKIVRIQNAAIIGLSSIIGVVDDCGWMKPNQKYYAWNTDNNGNQGFMCHNSNECKEYEGKFKSNDTIEIHLNVTKRMLMFYQNNKHIHSFIDIDLSVSYWLTVSCNQMKDSIQIMDFNINQISKMDELKFHKEMNDVK